MSVSFEEAIKPVLDAMPHQLKGIVYLYLESGGKPAEEDIKDNEKLAQIGQTVSSEKIIEKMKVAFQDGFGIIDWITGKYDNYGKCLDMLTKEILPQAFNVAKPKFKYSEETWDGITEREEWIRLRFFEHFWQGLGEEEKKQLIEAIADDLKEEGVNVDKVLKAIASGQGGLTVLRHLLGFKFHIFVAKVANMIAKIILGRGLSFAANAMLQRVISIIFGGPIGWGLFFVDIVSMLMPRDWEALVPAIGIIALSRPELEQVI